MTHITVNFKVYWDALQAYSLDNLFIDSMSLVFANIIQGIEQNIRGGLKIWGRIMTRMTYFLCVLFFTRVIAGVLPIKPDIHKEIQDDMYFCTAADEKHYPWLLHLIGSIHNVNFNETNTIAVFDLGFTKQQRRYLSSIQKVQIFDVERTHPDILKFFQSRPNPEKKMVRGWYAWKPVVIKQALEKFPYLMYLDSGCVVLKPLNNLFSYIQEHGYCLFNNYGKISDHATQYVRNKFKTYLDAPNITAGVQGLSRKAYDPYVLPMYELSKKLKNFQDDGTAPGGFGWARHDQTLFSILASMNKFILTDAYKNVLMSTQDKQFFLNVGDSYAPDRHIFWQCQGQLQFSQYIIKK